MGAKTAVDTIFVGRDRAYNRRFQQICGHYLVDPVACTPASGWEKGQVENQVGVVRRRVFVPRPKFGSFAELNAWLEDRCIAYAKANRHPDIPDKTIWEVFEEERSSLLPYVGSFDGFHAVPASVSRTCLVRFDKNRCSVDARAVGRADEISEKQARSIKYQMTIAKLPLVKESKKFDFGAAEVNETLIRDLATGDFLDHQRNLVLIGGTGTGKTHLAVSIARACIRNGRRGRFFNVVDLVNKLDAEARAERQSRTADLISRLDFLILHEPGYLPLRPDRRSAPVPPDQQALRADLDYRHDEPHARRMAHRLRGRQDDHGTPRPAHPPLRDRRDRQRQLALQEPSITQTAPPLARRRCAT